MRSDTFILLDTQKNVSDDDPATEAIYEVGTLASVLRCSSFPTAPSRYWSRAHSARNTSESLTNTSIGRE
jgi:ATP-dependent Lon protease